MKDMGMFSDFKTFMFKHKIPATAAAFSVGGASAEMAKTMSQDIVLPLVIYIIRLVYPRLQSQQIKWVPFIGSVVSWACVLVTSYVLMELVFSRTMLGASLVVLDRKEEDEFQKAKDVAKEPIEQASKAIKKLVVGGVEADWGSDMYAPVDPSAPASTEPAAFELGSPEIECAAEV